MSGDSYKLIANNKKAYHEYFIDEKYEAGISLAGTEVKSCRMGKCSIKEAFVRIEDGQVYLYGMHISPYEKGNIFNRDSVRVRKLLMHKDEIRKLDGKVRERELRLCLCRSILRDRWSRFRLALPAERNSMTRERTSRRKICAARRSAASR